MLLIFIFIFIFIFIWCVTLRYSAFTPFFYPFRAKILSHWLAFFPARNSIAFEYSSLHGSKNQLHGFGFEVQSRSHILCVTLRYTAFLIL